MSTALASNPRSTWIVLGWLAVLSAVIFTPHLTNSPTLGDDLIRYTVRLSLALYAAAAMLMMAMDGDDWTAKSPRGDWARWLWTLAWLTFIVHLGMAFHYFHHWSHAHAMQHTARRSGLAEGIYVSHLFTLLWTCDVLTWWLRPQVYARRAAWIGRTLHAFMIFMIFNGTVVYETGLIRWAGLAGCSLLAAEWLYVHRGMLFTAQHAPPSHPPAETLY